jgi:hypothetical protein
MDWVNQSSSQDGPTVRVATLLQQYLSRAISRAISKIGCGYFTLPLQSRIETKGWAAQELECSRPFLAKG